MSVSSVDVSCHNDIRTKEYVEYVRACSPLHNPDKPMGANLNLSRVYSDSKVFSSITVNESLSLMSAHSQ